ncbi:MAG: AlpA family phage regulatory protein [Sphingomonas sp.]|uniref:helix-turn-helix transcriptional regulator n=1 Tax=Sphingomonas sp. TaxID=28214 RepID=UPI0025F77135|nr:AlpA family phage regulatory protein [Sphingomonas sp.]MBX3562935.1 AlpA family phage regulatory protein [Sphingomonas sp.]
MSDMSNPPAAAPSGRFLRMRDLAIGKPRPGAEPTQGALGLSQATINRLHREGKFPRKVELSPNCIGWWESEILAWKAERQRAPKRS